MLVETPVPHITSKNIVEKLKRLQLILGSKSVRVKKQLNSEEEDKNEEGNGSFFAKFEQLPTELLIQIFSHLQLQDIKNVKQVCRRFTNICNVYRDNFAILKLNSIAVRYGLWRDVLKQRIVLNEEEQLLRYRLLNNDDRRFQPTKKRRSGFLLRSKKSEKVPLSGLVKNCKFDTILLTAEMLNGDLRTALRLKELNASYIFCDFSHHSLQLHSFQRYLPQITNDLNTNAYVQNVDFIFESINEMSDNLLDKIIVENMQHKRVTVIFLKSRC